MRAAGLHSGHRVIRRIASAEEDFWWLRAGLLTGLRGLEHKPDLVDR
jgi:hypothetical protein